MIHFGLDPGKFICFLSGEYTGQYRNVRRTLDAVCDHITPEDYDHIKRILMDGCHAQFTFKEPLSNKLEFISRGNSKSFVDNPALVRKTMNKEDRYSHLVPMDPLLCKLSPYLRHTMQSIVIKEGKSDRIVWDGSTVIRPTDVVMNAIINKHFKGHKPYNSPQKAYSLARRVTPDHSDASAQDARPPVGL